MTAVRTTCPYCGVGCGLRIEREDAQFSVRGDPDHPSNFGRICSKGAALGETLDLDGRLLHPRVGGRHASWDEALGTVAATFVDTIERHGPDAVAFYVSGQLLTEDYYVANKLMKGFIGSGNIDTNSRLCMASAVAGYKRAFGADFVPNSYTDIEQADLLVVAGANMAWCHPVLFQRARDAKRADPCKRVVVIDPRRTATCDIADLHLPLKPGTDVMLFNGLLNYLRREDALDLAYLEAHTEGFAEALATARASASSIPEVAKACDLPEADVAQFYRWFAQTPRSVTLFSQGVNQSTSGTDKVNAIVNVHLATGRIGKAGAGPFSLTGQPNAMGGREVGGLANQLAAHMDFEPADIDRVERLWRAPRMAKAPGRKAVDLFEAVADGRIKALWIMSTNPVVSMPDADRVKAALASCAFVAVSDCVADTDTTALAHVLLPAAAWGEKSGTVTNSERRISRQRAFLPAPGQSRPDWWIVKEVAARMGHARQFDYASAADVFREHAALSAFENGGTRDFDIGALARLSDAQYEALEPVRWPVPVAPLAGLPGTAALGGPAAVSASEPAEPLHDGQFFTPSRKARLVAVEPRSPAAQPSAEFPFVLVTGRVRDQWHTMTRTGKSPRLAQTQVEPFVQMHPDDLAAVGVLPRGLAEVRSPHGSIRVRVEASDAQRRGEVFVPMHWSDRFASRARVGSLIASAVDAISGQPELKCTPVAVAPVHASWHGFVLSRDALDLTADLYSARSRGKGFWRIELAGEQHVANWSAWARAQLGDDGEWVELVDTRAGRYRAAKLAHGRLVSCVFTASSHVLPDRDWLGALFADAALGEADRRSLLAGRPASQAAVAGPVICACFSVGRDTLVSAIRTQQLTSVEAIGKALGAGTNCGSCIPELNGLIATQSEPLEQSALH